MPRIFSMPQLVCKFRSILVLEGSCWKFKNCYKKWCTIVTRNGVRNFFTYVALLTLNDTLQLQRVYTLHADYYGLAETSDIENVVKTLAGHVQCSNNGFVRIKPVFPSSVSRATNVSQPTARSTRGAIGGPLHSSSYSSSSSLTPRIYTKKQFFKASQN